MSGHITHRDPVAIVNPTDREWTSHRYLFWFGAYGWTKCLVWANSLDDALDEAIDWLAENAPGILCDEAVHEEYRRAIAEGCTEEQAYERSTVDTTCGGNCGHYLNSWEWNVCEDPDRATILREQGRTP